MGDSGPSVPPGDLCSRWWSLGTLEAPGASATAVAEVGGLPVLPCHDSHDFGDGPHRLSMPSRLRAPCTWQPSSCTFQGLPPSSPSKSHLLSATTALACLVLSVLSSGSTDAPRCVVLAFLVSDGVPRRHRLGHDFARLFSSYLCAAWARPMSHAVQHLLLVRTVTRDVTVSLLRLRMPLSRTRARHGAIPRPMQCCTCCLC